MPTEGQFERRTYTPEWTSRVRRSRHVLRFEGSWAPDLARLFMHLTYDVGIRLLALLEGSSRTSAQPQELTFLDGVIKAYELPTGRSHRDNLGGTQ